MLSILHLCKIKKINYPILFIFLTIYSLLGFYFPKIIILFIADMYLYNILSNFTLSSSPKSKNKSEIHMNITAEGIQKEENDMKSIITDYITKFN